MKTIKLTQGYEAIVDDADFEYLNQFKWCAHKKSETVIYVVRKENKKMISMHREIMGFPKDMVDHRNHNTLDNRRENLRVANNFQNQQNRNKVNKTTTSKYKGVCLFKRDGTWKAQIRHNGKCLFLGYYDTELEAKNAYDKKAKELFGEFYHSG